MKDNFSTQAELYAKFRPSYPAALYDYLFSLVETKDAAWDCGTGSGQIAQQLATEFNKVYATDISEKQIANAVKRDNIFYKVEGAEQTSFADRSFDLITVAQAIHWFNFDAFYKEVKRTLKPGGIFAVIGYALLKVDESTDKIIRRFHDEITGPYWDIERKYINELYQTIPFPFREIDAPVLAQTYQWTFEQMLAYFKTWSSVQHYIKAKQQNPVDVIYKDLKQNWPGNSTKQVTFPTLMRVGKL